MTYSLVRVNALSSHDCFHTVGWFTGMALVVDKGFFFWDSAHMDPVWRTLEEKAS